MDGGLLSPAQLRASVPGPVVSLLDRIGSSPAAPAPPRPPSDFVNTEEDAQWFRKEGEGELPEWLKDSGAPPRQLYPGETELDASAWFDDEGDCLVDMPDWRQARAAKEGRQAPQPAPDAAVATRSPEATAAATAAAFAAFEAEAAAKAAKAREAREASDVAEWDGQADETAYFDYDVRRRLKMAAAVWPIASHSPTRPPHPVASAQVDDDLPDWREARRS